MPWFSDHAGPPSDSRPHATSGVAFRLLDSVGTPITLISRLNSLAYTHPCQRFAAPSRDTNA